MSAITPNNALTQATQAVEQATAAVDKLEKLNKKLSISVNVLGNALENALNRRTDISQSNREFVKLTADLKENKQVLAAATETLRLAKEKLESLQKG